MPNVMNNSQADFDRVFKEEIKRAGLQHRSLSYTFKHLKTHEIEEARYMGGKEIWIDASEGFPSLKRFRKCVRHELYHVIGGKSEFIAWLCEYFPKIMKLFLTILLTLVIYSCQTAFANPSIALKSGYTVYRENGDSHYVGNTVYDSEIAYGVFLRWIKNNKKSTEISKETGRPNSKQTIIFNPGSNPKQTQAKPEQIKENNLSPDNLKNTQDGPKNEEMEKAAIDWVFRFDIDRNKTGNCFKGKFNYPYEAIDLKQTRFILSGGPRFLKHFYTLLGIGLTHNDGEIELYPHPLDQYSYSFKDNINYSVTFGVEQHIDKWFMFIEYRYVWEEMAVKVNGENVLIENTSNNNMFFGLGRSF